MANAYLLFNRSKKTFAEILLLILLMLYGMNSFGQSVIIDTLFLPATERFNSFKVEKLKYPIIRTGNPQIDTSINNDLKDRFTDHEYCGLSTDSAIINWAGDQVVYMGFEITYNKNGLISFNISAEGCGSYCTGWTRYFTYSVNTGKYLTINELIDTSGKFRKIILTDKDKQYEQYKRELFIMLSDKQSPLEKDTYDWVMEYYNDCQKNFVFNSFALYEDHLEIIETCPLPNAIKSLNPSIELIYKYKDIRKFIKIAL